jgi:peroxiredoxin
MAIINKTSQIIFGLLIAYGGVIHFTVDVAIWKNDFLNAIYATQYLWQIIGIINFVFGLLLVFNRLTILSLLMLLPITFNIFIYHAHYQMDGGLWIGIPVFALNLFLLWQNKEILKTVIMQKTRSGYFFIIISFILFSFTKIVVNDFRLKNMDEKMVSLSDFKNEKGIILTFITNSCPVSEMYQKRIADLEQNFKLKGFKLIAINPEDNFAEMKKINNERQYKFDFLYDADQSVSKKYGIKANTHTLVLVPNKGGFKKIYEGAIDDDYSGEDIKSKYVEMAIAEYLDNKKVSIAKTKVLGCAVNYRK